MVKNINGPKFVLVGEDKSGLYHPLHFSHTLPVLAGSALRAVRNKNAGNFIRLKVFQEVMVLAVS